MEFDWSPFCDIESDLFIDPRNFSDGLNLVCVEDFAWEDEDTGELVFHQATEFRDQGYDGESKGS